METTYLSIREMYCSACATRIEKVVSRMDGVIHITVNLATETGRVTFHEKKIRVTEIIDKIKAIGFEATIATKGRDQIDKTKEIQRLWQRFLCSTILTIPLAWAMLAHFQWATFRSEERRVGKECRSRDAPCNEKKNRASEQQSA